MTLSHSQQFSTPFFKYRVLKVQFAEILGCHPNFSHFKIIMANENSVLKFIIRTFRTSTVLTCNIWISNLSCSMITCYQETWSLFICIILLRKSICTIILKLINHRWSKVSCCFLNRGHKEMYGLFFPMFKKGFIFVVDTVRSNQMPTLSSMYNTERMARWVKIYKLFSQKMNPIQCSYSTESRLGRTWTYCRKQITRLKFTSKRTLSMLVCRTSI